MAAAQNADGNATAEAPGNQESTSLMQDTIAQLSQQKDPNML